MKKFGDPQKIGKELSRQHLRRRRWLSVLLKTTLGLTLTLLTAALGYSAYWYFALSRPIEREAALTPLASAASTLAVVQAAQDGYARQIQSVRFRGSNTVHHYNGSRDNGETTDAYEVASKGPLYYSREIGDSRYGTKPEETMHSEVVWIFDGQTMRQIYTGWNGSADSVRAKETYGVSAYLPGGGFKPHDPNAVLKYGYKVDGVWIGEMLRRGKPSVEGIVTDARFGPLTVVRCQNRTPWGSKEDVRLWLAPKYGWIAVKTETKETGARPPFGLEMVHQTNRLVKSGAFWVARAGQMRYSALALGRQQALGAFPQNFTDIVFNDVPDSRFVAHYPLETRFWTQATDAHPSLPTTMAHYLEARTRDTSNNSPWWLYVLVGFITLGAAASLFLVPRWKCVRLAKLQH